MYRRREQLNEPSRAIHDHYHSHFGDDEDEYLDDKDDGDNKDHNHPNF